MALVLILFTIAILINEKWNTAIMPNNGVPFVLTFELQFFLIGILGVIITFAFFYKNKYLFTKKTLLGKYLQYIGRKTLNIYFLHYFFLPRNLEIIGQFFKENSNPSLEFLISIMISIWVILLSLVIRKIICLSEFFAYYLFGTKSNR